MAVFSIRFPFTYTHLPCNLVFLYDVLSTYLHAFPNMSTFQGHLLLNDVASSHIISAKNRARPDSVL